MPAVLANISVVPVKFADHHTIQERGILKTRAPAAKHLSRAARIAKIRRKRMQRVTLVRRQRAGQRIRKPQRHGARRRRAGKRICRLRLPCCNKGREPGKDIIFSGLQGHGGYPYVLRLHLFATRH